MISITPAIKSLKIRNLGLIRKADFKFTKGINIIYGPNGSGKTTILSIIKSMLTGEDLVYGPNRDKKGKRSGKTNVELQLLYNSMSKEITMKDFPPRVWLKNERLMRKYRKNHYESIEEFIQTLSIGERFCLYIEKAVEQAIKGQALLLDDVFVRLDHMNRRAVFELLKRSKLQAIITARREDELMKGVNVIKLKFVNKGNHPYVYSK